MRNSECTTNKKIESSERKDLTKWNMCKKIMKIKLALETEIS
jgi:hypothetical protein